MKKYIFLVAIFLLSISIFSQKKKSANTKKVANTASFAKVDNLSLELAKGDFVVSIDNKTATKDTIKLGKFSNNSQPIDCKIKPFTAKGTPLYLVTWIENSKIESKLSTEDIVVTNSIIINVANKSKVFSNKQLLSNIKLISYLDAKQTVSETIQKRHSEGYEFILLPDGDVLKKNKNKEMRLMYSTTDNIFIDFKKKK